jgi:hypothetical protein
VVAEAVAAVPADGRIDFKCMNLFTSCKSYNYVDYVVLSMYLVQSNMLLAIVQIG